MTKEEREAGSALLNPGQDKPPRKKRAASKMLVGVEMTIGELIDIRDTAPPGTTVIVIRGRAPTVKAGMKLAEKESLTGNVVIACERSAFKAAVVPQWLKGVTP